MTSYEIIRLSGYVYIRSYDRPKDNVVTYTDERFHLQGLPALMVSSQTSLPS